MLRMGMWILTNGFDLRLRRVGKVDRPAAGAWGISFLATQREGKSMHLQKSHYREQRPFSCHAKTTTGA